MSWREKWWCYRSSCVLSGSRSHQHTRVSELTVFPWCKANNAGTPLHARLDGPSIAKYYHAFPRQPSCTVASVLLLAWVCVFWWIRLELSTGKLHWGAILGDPRPPLRTIHTNKLFQALSSRWDRPKCRLYHALRPGQSPRRRFPLGRRARQPALRAASMNPASWQKGPAGDRSASVGS